MADTQNKITINITHTKFKDFISGYIIENRSDHILVNTEDSRFIAAKIFKKGQDSVFLCTDRGQESIGVSGYRIWDDEYEAQIMIIDSNSPFSKQYKDDMEDVLLIRGCEKRTEIVPNSCSKITIDFGGDIVSMRKGDGMWLLSESSSTADNINYEPVSVSGSTSLSIDGSLIAASSKEPIECFSVERE